MDFVLDGLTWCITNPGIAFVLFLFLLMVIATPAPADETAAWPLILKDDHFKGGTTMTRIGHG